MTEFLNAILAFPTVLFTIPLGVVVLYWLFVLLGALDIDLFGHGHADGAGHTDLHLDGHGHVDGHLDGHAHDGHGHDHGDADGHGGGLAGVLHALGLGGVPLTLMLSVLVLTGWVFCFLGMKWLGNDAPDWQSAGVALASLVAAVPVTSVILRPLRRLFRTFVAPQHRDLLGQICTITTLRVDERYGQAEIEDGGAGLIVQVRSQEPDSLRRGDRAVIFDYRDEVFHVAPLDEGLRRNLDQLGTKERV